MREFTDIIEVTDETVHLTDSVESLTLTFKQREKSRLKVSLLSGESVGLFLPRGSVLKQGDLLTNDAGDVLEVCAAEESVSTIYTDDMHLLLRIAYHLGNRHVPLQVESTWLRYAHDHVLDDMVRLLGGHVTVEQAPLQPESGAYGGGHQHGHDHESSHSHNHHVAAV
ncbi:Urease accessory protein UreE [Hydrogenovibrio crunogenus]|uniref:Urease accessory protein UreE n=1 Tax=Hydrogenovibrio crunogenus TaxID=39765 RepID=A0A4V1C8M8_9GAMM|nr:urease accessory protein UreE [Hydrogenovibrio crunogenus]QBZ82454.1 Urease accessory protein UreE [Hydrogenovibrio crunogenus]